MSLSRKQRLVPYLVGGDDVGTPHDTDISLNTLTHPLDKRF